MPARTDLTTTTVAPTSIKPPEQPKNLPVKDQLNPQPAQMSGKKIDKDTPTAKEKDIDKEKDRKIDEKSEKPKTINENAETQKQSDGDIKNEKERSSDNNKDVINPDQNEISPVVDKNPDQNEMSPMMDKNPGQNEMSPVDKTEGVKKRDIRIKARKRRMNQESRYV